MLADPSSAEAGGGDAIDEDVVSRARRPAQTILKSSAAVSLRKLMQAHGCTGWGVLTRSEEFEEKAGGN